MSKTTSANAFPPDITLTLPEFRKIRRWIHFRYARYSEREVIKNGLKLSSSLQGWWNSSTGRKKAVRAKLDELVDNWCTNDMPSDHMPVLQDSVYQHLTSRIGAYSAAHRHKKVHNCISGRKGANLAGHVFLVDAEVTRKCLYEHWAKRQADPEWTGSLRSVGEFWKYGRFVCKIGGSNVRVEIWFDTRPYRKLDRLWSIHQYLAEATANTGLIKNLVRPPGSTDGGIGGPFITE